MCESLVLNEGIVHLLLTLYCQRVHSNELETFLSLLMLSAIQSTITNINFNQPLVYGN